MCRLLLLVPFLPPLFVDVDAQDRVDTLSPKCGTLRTLSCTIFSVEMAAVDQFGELYLIQYRSVVQMKIFQNENNNLEQDKIEICRSCILCLLHLRRVCAEKYLGDCSRKFLGFFWILHTHNTNQVTIVF